VLEFGFGRGSQPRGSMLGDQVKELTGGFGSAEAVACGRADASRARTVKLSQAKRVRRVGIPILLAVAGGARAVPTLGSVGIRPTCTHSSTAEFHSPQGTFSL